MFEKQIALENGLKVLSDNQQVLFTRYVRLVLPADGFIFWVKKSLIRQSNGAINNFMLNSVPINDSRIITEPDDSFYVEGSFHYSTENVQETSRVYGRNIVVFTTTSDIDDFNNIGESELLIGTFDDVQFAFSSRGKFYRGAGLFHYTGEAINPIMRSHVIDSLEQVQTIQVVNDSLPIWMLLNKYAPVYPAYRGLQNARPPFMSVEIIDSVPLQQAPFIDKDNNRDQLCKDTVEITCYGLDNNAVLDYIHYVVREQALIPFSGFGICNTPISKTVNIPQSELNVTANTKKITFEINYYQSRTIDIARQLILEAFVECLPNLTYPPN